MPLFSGHTSAFGLHVQSRAWPPCKTRRNTRSQTRSRYLILINRLSFKRNIRHQLNSNKEVCAAIVKTFPLPRPPTISPLPRTRHVHDTKCSLHATELPHRLHHSHERLLWYVDVLHTQSLPTHARKKERNVCHNYTIHVFTPWYIPYQLRRGDATTYTHHRGSGEACT